MDCSNIDLVLAAAKFAAEKHRGQTRKSAAETAYINHPLEVAEMLARVGQVGDPEILAAALLHDTIEDTGTKPEEIEDKFGGRISSLVQECTDDKSLPKEERKRLQIINASHKSPGAKLIKIADKISNVKDVIEAPPPDWSWQRRSEYLEWARHVFDGLKGGNQDLDALFESMYARGRQTLDAEAASLPS